MSTVTERPVFSAMPENWAPFAFTMHASARGVEHWKPEHGVVLPAETMQAAGIRRLAAKHPGGVPFIERKFRRE